MPTKKELELAISILQATLKEQEGVQAPKKRGRKPGSTKAKASSPPTKGRKGKPKIVIANEEQTNIVERGTGRHKDDPSTYLAPIKANGKSRNRVAVGNDSTQGHTPCKVVPFEVKPRVNLFVDDGTEHKNDSVKLNTKGAGGVGARNIQIREKAEKTMVRVQCPACNEFREVDSRTIRVFGSGMPLIRCDRCIVQR